MSKSDLANLMKVVADRCEELGLLAWSEDLNKKSKTIDNSLPPVVMSSSSNAAAYLMLILDTTVAPPEIKGCTITSDNNPEIRTGLRWAVAATGYGVDFHYARRNLIDSILASPMSKWITRLKGWEDQTFSRKTWTFPEDE